MDNALREFSRAQGDIMVWGSPQAIDKAEGVSQNLPRAERRIDCFLLRQGPPRFHAELNMCLGERYPLYQLPSGKIVNSNGEVMILKEEPDFAKYNKAVNDFRVAMSCDVSAQPDSSC